MSLQKTSTKMLNLGDQKLCQITRRIKSTKKKNLNLHTYTIVIIIHYIPIIAFALVAAWQVYTGRVGGARFVFLAFISICV